MKKLLLLLVGAIVAIGAHAQLYLCGQDFEWKPEAPREVSLVDGWYNFQTSNKFKMSRSKGDWSAFNGNSLNFDGNAWTDNGSIKENSLTPSTSDTGDKVAPTGYTYLRVSADFTKIQASKDGNFEGGDTPSATYRIKGDFTGTGWTLENLPYEHTFDGTQGEQKYGLVDNNEKFYSGNTTFNGSKVTWTITGNLGDDKIAANYRGKVRFSVEGNVLTVEPVGETTTTYELWTNFGNGDTFVGYLLNEANNYSYTLNFNGTENGTKAGLHVDGAWKGASNTSAYDGNTKVYNMTATEGGDITFAAGLKGAVKFVLDVATSTFTVSGGTIGQGGDENNYTIYFYDKNNIAADGLYVHIWNGTGNTAHTFRPWGMSEDIKMQPTGKYIFRDGKYYPIYVLNFSWNEVPEQILVWNGVSTSEKKYTEDAVFVNNGYYTNGATTAETNLSPVEMGDVYIYFHFKEDLIFEGVNGINTPTYCHVMNGDNYISGSEHNDAHKMELVSSKYQIYRYKLTAEERANGNNVEFAFQNKPSIGGWATFRASHAEHFNRARWTEFIFSSAKRDVPGVGNNKQYAVQTYLSWSDFAALDAQGRPAAYLVGQGAIDGLNWTPANAVEFINKDGSCFYIPVNSNSTERTFFKISWVNVKYYKAHATEGMTDDARDWATFDLGIVGVDDQYDYPDDSYELDIRTGDSMGQQVNCTMFDVNTSVKYCNYNQYNWTIEKNQISSGTSYYVVIDTHETCRTVTLVNFDPNPSVTVRDTEVAKQTLSPEQAKALHRHYDHLGLASYNGHIPMDKVNTCEGTLVIGGSRGLDIDNAGFNIQYSVAMNGDQVVSYTGKPGSIHLNYMPLATASDMEVRAMYTDKDRDNRKGTGLTFHSRIGSASVTVPENMTEPVAQINNAQYVKYAGDFPYGVLLDDISLSVSTDYNVYGDLTFTFDVPDADTSRRVQIIHSNHTLAPLMEVSTLTGWTPLVRSDENDFSNYDFDNGSNDWSSLIIKEDVNVPVMLDRYTDITEKSLLEKKTVKGLAHAIYPFLYQTNPTITVVPEQNSASAPRRAPGTLPEDLTGFAISHFDRTTPIEIEVDPSNAISGIEGVEADAAVDADAEYYTISGVRVMGQPTPGIYLCRKGDKVSKVVIR